MWSAPSVSEAPSTAIEGRRIRVRGVVQGVGFRPFVYRVATEEAVRGWVRNDPEGVTIAAFAPAPRLERFVARLGAEPPAAARIRDLRVEPLAGEAHDAFVIVPSVEGGTRALAIPADLATCPDCEAELFDPADRRHRYAFTNCTSCGPRFTIATGVPYDRPATTMAPFAMCPACRREYGDVSDRRFHAQPNACPVCGPRLQLEVAGPDGWVVRGADDPLAEVAAMLGRGGIVGIKGLGGYHLACDARSSAAVRALRARKHRDDKPFAVMARDLEAARALARVGPDEAALLGSPERPIVLVPRLPSAAVADEVAPDSALLGVFLPYTPLHHLLLGEVGRPLVMTSANRAGEPICQLDEEARARLAGIADALLVHDRVIATRCDDSVARVIDGAPTVLRRSRGYVPRAVPLARPVPVPVLACGAHLKNTFCLARGDSAYLGPHVGDLDTPEAVAFLAEAIERMERLLDVRPEVIAHDLHPDYESTRYALSRAELVAVGVQHHHAHVASAMAEHGLEGPVLGVAFDGTGYGTDGTAWGAEVLLAGYDGFRRLATFRPLALPGGERAIRQVWRVALALLDDAFAGEPPLDALPLFARLAPDAVDVVRQLVRRDVLAPRARGMGRYFDAIGALVLGRAEARHEGQVAVALGEIADPTERGVYPFELERGAEQNTVDLRAMVRALVEDLRAGRSAATLSARFQNTVVLATTEAVRAAVRAVGPHPVVLTGGCFQNPHLAAGLRASLGRSLEVHVHREVPPGDGGIALGQAMVAAARRVSG